MNGGVERIKVREACRCGLAGMTLLEALAGVVIKQEEPHLAALLHYRDFSSMQARIGKL